MYDGIPRFIEMTAGLVKAQPGPSSLSIMAYHLLGDIVLCAEHAMGHYFNLTLQEDYLQNSSRGTPYEKWAMVNNENFKEVASSVKAVIPVMSHLFNLVAAAQLAGEGSQVFGDEKTGYLWMHRLGSEYRCCQIEISVPCLHLQGINYDGWLDEEGTRFVRNGEMIVNGSVINNSELDISDRTEISRLHSIGSDRVGEMKRIVESLAAWLLENVTMENVVKPHQSPVSWDLFR